MDPISSKLAIADDVLDARWSSVERFVTERFGKEASIEGILFLIGIQSRGRGFEPEMAKETKQDTIMEGTFCAFEKLGIYERVGVDEQGFWLWERAVESIPSLPIEEQEKLLKLGIICYFDEELSA